MRLAVVGCGDASRTVSLASRFARGVSISAFVDLEVARARSAAKFHRTAAASEDWHTLIRENRPDAVYIAVPHYLHSEIALAFAGAGIPVLLEKPLAESLAAATGLLETLPVDAKLGVFYQYRYDPRAWALVGASRDGSLGTIRYVSVDVPWSRESTYFSQTPWHGSKRMAGGGTLLTQGSHALDIGLLCAGGHPARATGQIHTRVFTGTEIEDLAYGQIETSSGVPVMVTSSMVSRPGFRVRIAVYGSNGSAVYSGPGHSRLRGHGVRLRQPPVFTELHAYSAALRGFADWVAGRGDYRCKARDGIAVLAAVDGIYRSAEARQTVRIEPPSDKSQED